MPRYDWDDAKAAANFAKHGVEFESVSRFEWSTALVLADERHQEPRYRALGLIGTRLHTLGVHMARRNNARHFAAQIECAGNQEL